MKAGRKPKDQINTKGEWQPTIEQLKCMELDLQGITHKEIAKQLNITEQSIVAWFRNGKFNEYREKERDIAFGRYGPHIDKSLIKKGLKGNIMAIRTYYEKRGEIGSRSNQGGSNVIIVFPGIANIPRPQIKPIEVKAIEDNNV